MKLSLGISPHFTENQIRELGVLAESVGIDSFWLPNILDGRDPYPALSVLARSTSKLRLGVAAISPWEAHPIKTALQFLTLNETSQGRARLMISGGGEFVHALNLNPHRRVRAVSECIEIIKAAGKSGYEDKPLNYQGELFQVSGFDPVWVSQAQHNVVVAANEPMMLKMSARVSDGTMIAVLPPQLIRKIISQTTAHLGDFSRPSNTYTFENWWPWHIKKTSQAAKKEAIQWLSYQGIFRRHILTTFMTDAEYDVVEQHKSAFYAATHGRSQQLEGIDPSLVNRIIDELTTTGPIDDIDRHVKTFFSFKQSGLNNLTLRLYGSYQEHFDAITLIGDRVLPVLTK